MTEELKTLLTDLLGRQACDWYLNPSRQQPRVTFRTNTLKAEEHEILPLLAEEGFAVRPVDCISGGYYVEEERFSLGKSLAHAIGAIYIQDQSSMLPPLVLDLEKGQRVLDMAAAPGSKTTEIAALLRNTGWIVANEASPRRVDFLGYNLSRSGVINAAVARTGGSQLGRLFPQVFHRVLVDPPCSGLGTVQKTPEVLKWWTYRRSYKLARIQRDLLVSGLKALREEGILVYSTCTLVPEENEGVLAEIMARYPVELQPVQFPDRTTRPGLTRFRDRMFPSSMARCARIYPHESPGEGFFIGKLRKIGRIESRPVLRDGTRRDNRLCESTDPQVWNDLDHLSRHFGIPEEFWSEFLFLPGERTIRMLSRDSITSVQGPFVQHGLTLINRRGARPALTTWGAQCLGRRATRNVIDFATGEELRHYLSRKALHGVQGDGQQIVRYRNHPIGHGIALGGKLLSRARARQELATFYTGG